MKLKVLGSGSSGNCYILENDAEAFIIEAGVSFKEVKKALNFNISKIVGVAVSHSHKDHEEYADEYDRAGISIFSPYKTEPERQSKKFGGFLIKSFQVEHNVPCCGFLIQHSEMGKLLFATDTEYVKYRFKQLNHIMIEANYSKDLITDSPEKRTHVLTGHMDIETTCDFIKVNRTSSLRDVVLLHLSGESADAGQFKIMAEKAVGRKVNVFVAQKGLEIDLDLCPF